MPTTRSGVETAEALIGKLGSGLAVFVGREKSAVVVREIWKAVGTSGPAA
jgi:hypothetical protein